MRPEIKEIIDRFCWYEVEDYDHLDSPDDVYVASKEEAEIIFTMDCEVIKGARIIASEGSEEVELTPEEIDYSLEYIEKQELVDAATEAFRQWCSVYGC